MRYQGLTESLHSIADNTPRFYITCIIAISFLVMFFLYAPIIIAFTLLASIAINFQESFSLAGILNTLIKLIVTGGCIFLSYQFFITRVERPKGALLDKAKAPKLLALIEELRNHYHVARLDYLVASDNFEVTLNCTPKFGIPFFTTNTIQIGLPVMQSTSPKQLQIMLARRLGQLSLTHNKATGIVLRFYQFILAYNLAFSKSNKIYLKPHAWAYKFLSDFYYAVAFYAFHQDELLADRYALEIANDEELAVTISQTIVANHFLKTKYWPHIYKLARQTPRATLKPHANMSEAIIAHLTPAYCKQVLTEHFNRIADYQYFNPPLRARLHNISHEEFVLPETIAETAARYYLGDTLTPVTNLFDKVWQTKNQMHKQNLSTDNAQQQRLASLAEKIKQTSLSSSEAWEYASLTEKLQGYQAAIPVYKKILEKNPQHAKAMFAVGRILLSYNDNRGVYVLEQAVELDASMKRTAHELIDRFKARQAKTLKPAQEVTA